MRLLWLTFIAIFSFAVPACADGDIVYAARYYTPPGSHRTSHFHLYRINPDGTGKRQLTFGNNDDYEPCWSPDGKRIAFTRNPLTGNSTLCLMSANGRKITIISKAVASEDDYFCRWSPDSCTLAVIHQVYAKKNTTSVFLFNLKARHVIRRFAEASEFQWSPDGTRAYVPIDSGDVIVTLSRTGASQILVHDIIENALWLNNIELIGRACDEKGRSFLRVIGANGRERQHMSLKFPASYPGQGIDDTDPAERGGAVLSVPGNSFFVYALNNHNSTVGVDNLFFWLDPLMGRTQYLTEGQFLAWSPNGTRFVTAPGRDTALYSYWPDGQERTVWAAPLYIRAAKGGAMRALTPRLSWVTGADWRKARQ